MAGFRAAASARYPTILVAGLLPHHCPATRISNLHLPPAGYPCFTHSCIVRRRGCGAASFSRVPPLRTPAEESLHYFSDSRRRRQALPGAARALGTVCLLRVAAFVSILARSRLARSRSITRAAASGGDHGSLHGDSGRPDRRTPIMLEQFLAGKQADSARIHLVNQVFTEVLHQDKQLQLLELVYQLAFPENLENLQKSFSEVKLLPYERLQACLAIAQIYMEMGNYEDAMQVLNRLPDEDILAMDAKVPLLKVVLYMTWALDLLVRSKGTITLELRHLIFESKEWSDKLYKLIEESPTPNED